MPHTALTNAPILQAGVTLAIMATPQLTGDVPARLADGERMPIRFGYCCPQIEEATVVRSADDRIVLSLGVRTFVLRPGAGGVDVPGIVSDEWIVA